MGKSDEKMIGCEIHNADKPPEVGVRLRTKNRSGYSISGSGNGLFKLFL